MTRFNEPILVTRPFLPALEDFKRGCEEIWQSQWLTNNGPLLRRFQHKLSEYLCVPESNIALFNNGTLALELGYQAMGLSDCDVITTPFTFVATSHALKRIGATPIFADIDPDSLCLDPKKCERLITSRTKAIVPVHVYGNPCDVEGFEQLRERYGVKIIYDAAHAFGVKELVPSGDMSMYSFHPTKLFHSCEGGLLVFKNAALQAKLFELRNFAIHSETECADVGSNAKMNELQALMGLECLKSIGDLLEYRKKIYDVYRFELLGCDTIKLISNSANKAYVPVLFKDFSTRERVYSELKEKCNVYARRYFYPLLTDFAPYVYAHGTCPIAEDIAQRVLTLPTYHGLPLEYVRQIAQAVKELSR